jgi:flagellar biosynthesis/type III secretory pathway protein FliH
VRAWNDYEEKKLIISEAESMLAEAIKSGDEKNLRNAIKKGVRAGMKWTDSSSKRVYCTMIMKEVINLFIIIIIYSSLSLLLLCV